MRAKEFINEIKLYGSFGDLNPDVSAVIPGAIVQRKLRNTDPYMQYRYGVAAAAARAFHAGEVDFDQESAWAENLALITYTDEDEETVKLANKIMGVDGSRIAEKKSKEPDGTNVKSPVATPKKNRYGV